MRDITPDLDGRWAATENKWAEMFEGESLSRGGCMWRGNPTPKEIRLRKILPDQTAAHDSLLPDDNSVLYEFYIENCQMEHCVQERSLSLAPIPLLNNIQGVPEKMLQKLMTIT